MLTWKTTWEYNWLKEYMDLLAVEQAAYALQQHYTIHYTPHMCVIVCDV